MHRTHPACSHSLLKMQHFLYFVQQRQWVKQNSSVSLFSLVLLCVRIKIQHAPHLSWLRNWLSLDDVWDICHQHCYSSQLNIEHPHMCPFIKYTHYIPQEDCSASVVVPTEIKMSTMCECCEAVVFLCSCTVFCLISFQWDYSCWKNLL